MKNPNEYWHAYKNDSAFPANLTPEEELNIRLAFHSGIATAFVAMDSLLAEEPKLSSDEMLTMIKWFRRHNVVSGLIAATKS
jgi:hypothetical protein